MNEDKRKRCSNSPLIKSSPSSARAYHDLGGEGGADLNIGVILTAFLLPGCRARHRRRAPRSHHRNLLSRSQRQDNACLADFRGGSGAGRYRCLIDAEHAPIPFTPRASGRYRRGAHLPARHRRAGAEPSDSLCARRYRLRIVDSVAALVPRAEIEGAMGDTTVGLQARLMSQALRKLAGSLSKSNTTCIFINQLREKIGVMFGNPETTTGGRALKFFPRFASTFAASTLSSRTAMWSAIA